MGTLLDERLFRSCRARGKRITTLGEFRRSMCRLENTTASSRIDTMSPQGSCTYSMYFGLKGRPVYVCLYIYIYIHIHIHIYIYIYIHTHTLGVKLHTIYGYMDPKGNLDAAG